MWSSSTFIPAIPCCCAATACTGACVAPNWAARSIDPRPSWRWSVFSNRPWPGPPGTTSVPWSSAADMQQEHNMEAPSATAITPPATTRGKKEFVPPGPVPEVLSKRYRIERLLGVGGMGAVYRARDLLREQFGDPEPWVAVKALNDTFAEYPAAHALLYSEFALTSRLRHAHVVQLYGFHTDARCRRAYITMELLKGPTLDDLISANPEGLPWEQFREIA